VFFLSVKEFLFPIDVHQAPRFYPCGSITA
jgi:hypothetical protein